MKSASESGSFHTFQDNSLQVVSQGHGLDQRMTGQYLYTQTRTLTYRFFLHQHPYAQQLLQRLQNKGVRGLQEADTDYTSDGTALAGSVQIWLAANTVLNLPNQTQIVLLTDLLVNGQLLKAGLSLSSAPVTAGIRFQHGLYATLVAAQKNCPLVGEPLPLASGSAFTLDFDTRAILQHSTAVQPAIGSSLNLPANSEVLLARGSQLVLSSNLSAILRKRRLQPRLYADFFKKLYLPAEPMVAGPHPVKDLDFTSSGAYSAYNWELFFHVPLTIAMHLSKNQRFAEAQHWFHYLFDPTTDSSLPSPERFWKVRPFQSTDVQRIEDILTNLASNADPALRADTLNAIAAWQTMPFRPHLVARYRQQAYMFKTVMAYLDNLIAWGDSLFRQDTGEAIDEAMMLYVMAANILGPRPQMTPKKGHVQPQTYANLRGKLQPFGVVLLEMEADLPFDLLPTGSSNAVNHAQLASLRSIGQSMYFCVPRNDKLLGYWDTVADRLFKIRNSLNLQGIFRQLALFEPPIDPALLARATAAGQDVGSIINGLNQPLPLVRFALLLQKASEITQEVKALGGSLLSAMEKEDGEALAILRARHERIVMEMAEHVKYGQLQEAIKAKEGSFQSLALAVQRYTYFERQLGRKADEIAKSIPELGELDTSSLQKMKFAMKEPVLAGREFEVDIAQDLGDAGGKIISSYEAEELDKSSLARTIQDVVKGLNLGAQALSFIPDFGIDLHFWGLGGNSDITGGSKLSQAARFGANVVMAGADRLNYEAGLAAKIGGYARREQEWAYQSSLAAGEITQVFKQLRGAQIREAVAEQELKNHRQQIKHAKEVERFINAEGTEKQGKKTNQALYTWMKREVRGLYAQSFQFAFEIAKKAERALQHELGKSNLTYLQLGYMGGKEGLLAGEKLQLDLKRMEMAYLEQNSREYEMTRHISVLQLEPGALLQLRHTGRCIVRLPEALFDMDGPGHYFRRIKSVAISIPCVTGPYASVNCTLTQLKSSIRKSAQLKDGLYAREDAEDERFSDHFGSTQSIVTSSAQNDSGMFETNLRDERYLPFEYSGAVSEWQLALPANPANGDPCQFDYASISDVILHLRYTAREGGAQLKSAAMSNLKALFSQALAYGSRRLFSLRHEFPTEWARFQASSATNGQFELEFTLIAEHYPLWSVGRLEQLKALQVLAQRHNNGNADLEHSLQKIGNPAPLASGKLSKDDKYGKLIIKKSSMPDNTEVSPLGKFKLLLGAADLPLGAKELLDVWLVLDWQG